MIEHIVDYINSKGRFKSSRELILNSLFFHIGSYSSIVNPVILLNGKQLKVNYFGISISGSASGKSFVYNQTKKLFDTKKWEQALIVAYERANQNIPDDIVIDGVDVHIKDFLPNYENNIEGTKEGIYLRALALSKAFSGSLNVVHEEIMDVIKDSNINTMKELYDGQLLGKIIKGSVNENIYGITSNMLLFGSSVGLKRDQKVYDAFIKAMNSGVYRRSFIYYQEPTDIESNNGDVIDIPNLEPFYELISKYKDNITTGMPCVLELKEEALEYIELINSELIEFSNKHKNDERFGAEIGSFDKIVKLSGLLAILEGKTEIGYEHIEYAYSFYKSLRNTNSRLFNVEPQYKRIYSIIRNEPSRVTKSEILERDIFNRMTFNEDLLLVSEQCYRNNERLIVSGSKIKFYEIKDLERTNLNKIICSVPRVDKKEKSIDYDSYQLALFGSEMSIEKLVLSDKVSNFCLTHFEKGKRKKENCIEKINAIGLDIDNGSLEAVIELLEDVGIVYLIYTTKSHRIEKNGFVSDRFRVIIPFKNIINIEPDRYSKLVENIASSLDIDVIDENALDMSRLWFTNSSGSICKNEDGILFDAIPFLPDTETNEKIDKTFVGSVDDEEIERRIKGMMMWTIANTSEGNRNMSLLKLGLFVLDLTGDKDLAKAMVLRTNDMIDSIPEKEIKQTIFRTIDRK